MTANHPTNVGRRAYIVRLLAVFMAVALIASACGGSDTSVDTPVVDNESGASDPADPAAGAESRAESGSLLVEVRSVELPEGVEVFVGDPYTASFGSAAYMVSPREEGVRLVMFDEHGARDTDAVITGTRVAQVFNSGGRIVMTGRDSSANLVVLASEDGTTFTETLIPIPQQYVVGDVWTGTSLRADVAGLADLNGDLFLIAWIGLTWEFPRNLVAQYGYTISEEVGDAATSSGIIRSAPQGDGDTLYTFEKNDEVVLEVLGSEAGLEPGYEDAYDAFYAQENPDVGSAGAWIVANGVATQTVNPPLNGELDQDLRLHQLYSVGDGVAAIVTDFSPGASASQQYVAAGALGFSALGALRSGLFSEWSYGVHHSWDGEVWETTGDPVGDPAAPPPQIFIDPQYNTFGWFQSYQDTFVIDLSDDGVAWEAPEWTIDITLPGGSKVEIMMIDGEIIQLFHPTTEDGDYKAFKVTLDEDGGDAFVEDISIETGSVMEWDGSSEGSVISQLDGVQLPGTTTKVNVVVVKKGFDVNSDILSALFFGDGLRTGG